MANAHGSNVVAHMHPDSAASVNLTADLNNVSLRWDKSNAETTTFSKNTLQRISGLRDISLDYAGVFNTGTGTVEAALTTEIAASKNTLLVLAFGGSITGSPIYSGCYQISNLSVTGPLNGPVAISFTAQHSSGSLTRGTVA